jgi:transcriptional regulator with XRE-family HTH domain
MHSFSEIVEKIKELKGLKHDYEVAELLNIKQNTISTNKNRNSISIKKITAFCHKEGISLNWLLHDEGPMKISTKNYPENHGSLNTYMLSENKKNSYPVTSPSGSNDSGIEPSLQAMSDIKEIFDSGDPILIPAIQANLNAFKRALLRERQFAQVIDENKDLRSRIVKLENLCKSLQGKVNRLTATYEDPEGDSKDCSNHDTKK